MESSNSRYLDVASGHIDGLINYVLDVKPYHTKLSEVVEEYLFEDNINFKFREEEKVLAFLGADILDDLSPKPGMRLRRSDSWLRDITSDGSRRTWPISLTSIHKFLSHSNQEKFVAGINDDYQIPGIGMGIYNQRRWDGPGITDVRVNNIHQQDSIDYFLSHGVHSFSVYPGQRWKQYDAENVSAFGENPGELLYQDVFSAQGIIRNITNGNYEEWTLTCISVDPAVLEVRGSTSGVIGTCAFNSVFSDPLISFEFVAGHGEIIATIALGNKFVITPFRKITVSPSAIAQTWSIIKTNPIALSGKPVFTAGAARIDTPSIEIHTRSLDNSAENSTWSITFTSSNLYDLQVFRSSDGGYTISGIDLKNGCSFKNDDVAFTLITTNEGFNSGDSFSWSVTERVENFLVYGSVSGWSQNAKLGEWYWNGEIGFKIPELEYFAKAYNPTIVSSIDGTSGSWNVIVSNNQILRSVDFDANSNAFFVAGDNRVVAASIDGSNFISDISSIYSPIPNKFLLVVGQDGLIATSEDGTTWIKQNSNTSSNLKASTWVPNLLSSEVLSPNDLNCIIVVGDNGTILTSISGIGWTVQTSGTPDNLNDIAWSNDSIVVVGDNGTVLRSQDRITWTQVPTFTTETLNAILYEPLADCFTIVGSGGKIFRSTDGGQTWNDVGAFSNGNLSDIAFGGGTYIIVSEDGYICRSLDGIVWTRFSSQRLNSVAFGQGKFIAVGGKESEVHEFQALKKVHSIAEPSTYTVTFVDSTHATVQNNIYGYRRGLVVGEVWEDEFASFILEATTPGVAYNRGDVVTVYLAPSRRFTVENGYDADPYDSMLFDSNFIDIRIPLLYNEELFQLFHSHGSVIFKNISQDDNIVIDKAIDDAFRFRIVGSSGKYSYLGAEDDWLPIEFRIYDRVSNSSIAEFSDLAVQIDGYLGSDPNQKVFSISTPRHKATNRNSSAVITLDEDFFNQYLPFGTKYSFLNLPSDSYGQKIRVKIAEHLKAYARVRLIFDDISVISIDDSPIQHFEITGNLSLVDVFNAQFIEGGALPVFAGYDLYPFDYFLYEQNRISNGVLPQLVESSPGVWEYVNDPFVWVIPKAVDDQPGIFIEQKPNTETAGTAFKETFSIVQYDGLTAERVSVLYDVNIDTPAGGLLINETSVEYLVNHNGPPSTPTLIVESLSNPGVYSNPIPNLNVYDQIPTAVSLKSFIFQLPPGFTAPFKLTIT